MTLFRNIHNLSTSTEIQETKNKELEQKLDTLINLTVDILIMERLIRFLVARALVFLKTFY